MNDSHPNLVVVDVYKRNVPISRSSVDLSEQRPELWSVVKFDPDKALPARISQQQLPLTYAVCPFCRARSADLPEGTQALKCEDCGKEASVDWVNLC